MCKKRLFVLGGLALFAGGAEAQSCSSNIKSLQEAFATFCSGESTCCTRPFYFNEEEVAVTFITQSHRQCSQENHPDKNPSLEAEEKIQQCNGGREVLEAHFSCLQEDITYRAWFLKAWPVEDYLSDCRGTWDKPLIALELQQKKERLQSIVARIRLGGYGV